jgi:glycosyltransferase involved in cell wall biosynthesis
MDRLLFPSLYEGLGIVLTEAQAAGLPSIVSDVVPSEADVVPALITRISLQQPAWMWAEEALRDRGCRVSDALSRVEKSPFNIACSVEALTRVYCLQPPSPGSPAPVADLERETHLLGHG